MSIRMVALHTLSAVLFTSFIGASCGQGALGILPGVINDPGNLSLRKAILSYGTSHLCSEVQKRSIPLKLRDEDPIIGRFFPTNCLSKELADKDLVIQFGGRGFAWTNLTQRMSFEASGTVQYDADFLLDGSTMYVYFRPKTANDTTFTTKLVERPQAGIVTGLPFGGGGRSIGDSIGAQIIKDEIVKGFTVIRDSNGGVEFGVGILEKGQHPSAPYNANKTGKLILANERSEVHQNQRDFVGPIEIPKGARLNLTVAIDGAPGIDVLVVPRYVGDAWLETYTTQAATTPPPNLPLLDEPVYSGAIWRRVLPLSPGFYYIVLDNTPTAGRTAPTSYAHDDRAALVSYGITLDE